MLVRASVNVAGLRAGQVGDLNGNDKAVRAALNAGYLERVDGEPEETTVVYDAPPEPAPAEDDAEGESGQDD